MPLPESVIIKSTCKTSSTSFFSTCSEIDPSLVNFIELPIILNKTCFNLSESHRTISESRFELTTNSNFWDSIAGEIVLTTSFTSWSRLFGVSLRLNDSSVSFEKSRISLTRANNVSLFCLIKYVLEGDGTNDKFYDKLLDLFDISIPKYDLILTQNSKNKMKWLNLKNKISYSYSIFDKIRELKKEQKIN